MYFLNIIFESNIYYEMSGEPSQLQNRVSYNYDGGLLVY